MRIDKAPKTRSMRWPRKFAPADRSRPHGAELVGELGRYEDSWRLCYVRGPEGIIIELAEQLN